MALEKQKKVIINFDITLTPKQQEIYDKIKKKSCRTLVALMSRQIGKTCMAEVLMIEYLCTPKTFNAYISPTFSQGKKVYSEMCSLLRDTGIIKTANASDLRIETTFGSVLKFFSMESPTAIRGYTIDGLLVLDEAAYFPDVLPNGEEPYSNVIYPITKARKPKVLCISTPNGKRGFFHSLYLRALNQENGFEYVKATIYDDKLVSQEEIEEIQRTISPIAFKQEFLCEFLSNALTVFPDFEKCFDIDRFSGGKCWIGIDPSTVGDDNTILTIVNEKSEVTQYKVVGSLDSKYAQLAALINQYDPVHTYMESNSIGEVMANEVKKRLRRKNNFSTFATTNESKKDYVSLIAVGIANGDLHFEKGNTLLHSECSTFTYSVTKAGNVTYAARQGFHDDTITSLGIALKCKEDYKYAGQNNSVFINSRKGFLR